MLGVFFVTCAAIATAAGSLLTFLLTSACGSKNPYQALPSRLSGRLLLSKSRDYNLGPGAHLRLPGSLLRHH